MNIVSVFLYGATIGISVAIICGPNTLLNIRRTLLYGQKAGLYSATGSVLGMCVHASIAASIGSSLVRLLEVHQEKIYLAVGVFLCCLGSIIVTSSVEEKVMQTTSKTLPTFFVSMFFLEVSSVLGISLFVSIMFSMNITESVHSIHSVFIFTSGVGISVFCLWLLVTCVLQRVRHIFRVQWFTIFNVVAGIIIVGFGVMNLLRL